MKQNCEILRTLSERRIKSAGGHPIHREGGIRPSGRVAFLRDLVAACILTVMNVDPQKPRTGPDRDRFVMSKGTPARRSMRRLP